MSRDPETVCLAAVRLAGLLERIRKITQKLGKQWCENLNQEGNEFSGEQCFQIHDIPGLALRHRRGAGGPWSVEDDGPMPPDESKFCPTCKETLRLIEERHALRTQKGSAIAAVTRAARVWSRGGGDTETAQGEQQ